MGSRQAPHHQSKDWGREKRLESESAPPVLDGEPRSLATGLATAQRNWRNRWRKSATPAGFESVLDITRPHLECKNTSEVAGFEEALSGHAGPICNDCNEVVPRLARVAKNALLNGDFPRAIAILDRLSSPRIRVCQMARQEDESGRPATVRETKESVT